MEIRAGPGACSGRADAPSRAESAVAPGRPEGSVFFAETPSSPPNNRFPGPSDPTAGKVNEGLAAVARRRGINATFGRLVEESESAIPKGTHQHQDQCPSTVVLSPPSPDRPARRCQRKAWREIQADQDSEQRD